MAEDKLSKITITRGVVFDKAPRNEGDVIDVGDDTRIAAEVLIRSGKAVAGEVKKAASANKAVGTADVDKR